jgi:UPF0755 protein
MTGRRGIGLRLLMATLLLGLAGALAAVMAYRQWVQSPLDVPGEGYSLLVPAGGSLNAVARELATAGILDHPALLVAAGRLRGQADRIHAGEYQLEAGLTPAGLLDRLVQGQVVLHSFTLVEGWTVRQILAALDKHPALERRLTATDATGLARELAFEEASAEGLFLPETYRFARGTTDRELLGMARAAMDKALAEAWGNRAPELPLADPYELLTLASIVERETGLASERPRIAGVFVRRLRLGMALQTDPTVIYGLGTAFDGNLTREHLRTDNPFNTYTRQGLPPTPIAAPGQAALQAVARPVEGRDLYFVASGAGDGSHRFSETLAEHNRAVQQYLAALRQQRRDGQ